MKYVGKKLPSGWTYILTKKEIQEINNKVDNCITSVILDGTSYSESKMSVKWATSKTVARIDFVIVDNNLCTYLYLHGLRNSNFKSDKDFVVAKDEVILDLTTIILGAKDRFEKNNLKEKSKFIKLTTAPPLDK